MENILNIHSLKKSSVNQPFKINQWRESGAFALHTYTHTHTSRISINMNLMSSNWNQFWL